MPDKKNRSSKKSSDKNPSVNITRGRSAPEKLSDETRYDGYDQERSSFNPSYESDYDVNEIDSNERSDEYKNYGSESSERKPDKG